jgi:hypothetical protein
VTAGGVVLTLAAGGLGGVTFKSAYDIFDRRHRERREDQHRFAAIKQGYTQDFRPWSANIDASVVTRGLQSAQSQMRTPQGNR